MNQPDINTLIPEGMSAIAVNGQVDTFEIRTADDKRHSIINIWIAAAEQKSPNLKYLRHYYRTMYRIQKNRIAIGNAESALQRAGFSPEEAEWSHEYVHKRLAAIERDISKRCKYHIRDMPIWSEYLEKISGIDVRLGASLIALVASPARFANVAKLWRYFGLDPVDGAARKRKKGETASWSAEGRMLCYKIADSFIKVGKGYRELYDQFKAREVEMNETRTDDKRISDGHVNNRARRRTVKLFLAHFLTTWREMRCCALDGNAPDPGCPTLQLR